MNRSPEAPFKNWDAWRMAIRPHTLPAGASPVLVGIALAIHRDVFGAVPALLALAGALLIQAATNLANDYYDAQRGVDEEREEGFTRVTSSGLLTAEQVWYGMVTLFSMAVLDGVYLVYLGGVPILAVGLAGIFCGITYSGGPMPFGSIGLGDLMVFLFFGVVAVCGTYYVQAMADRAGGFPLWIPSGTLPGTVLIASLPAAGFSTAVLVVNNIRDLDTDRAAGKKTLAVLIGRTASRIEYTALVGLTYVVPVWFLMRGLFSVQILLPLVSAPFAVPVLRTVWTSTDGEELNRALSRTGKLFLVHSILFAAGIILQR